VKEGSEKFLGVSPPEAIEGLSQQLKETFSGLDQEQVRKIWVAVKKTLLGGYSLTLTILNLLLLPFFIFYISRDLPKLHQFVHHQLPHSARDEIELVLGKMLDKVYAFFRGQLTVSLIMAVLFSIGLVIIGLPLPIAIGALAGLMNIVPYLGGMIGIVLATVVSLVTQGTLVDVLLVWLVFGVVQFLEGNFITPKIIGESVGIHPLIVIVSLIVFGSLFGLLGMIIAIPLAASIGVLAERYLITHEVAATGQL